MASFFSSLSVCLLTFVGAALAFGPSGHQIVAQLGNNMLTPAGLALVQSLLLPNQTMADVANWPDDYDHSANGTWSSCLHYANVLQAERLFSLAKDCVQVGDVETCCVVAAIMNYSSQIDPQGTTNSFLYLKRFLLNGSPIFPSSVAALDGEPTPLSFLIHFVGDIHQPLHIGYGCDEGGNLVNVLFFNEDSNLHDTWDTLMVDRYCGGDWQKFAAELQFTLDQDPRLKDSFEAVMNVTVWAEESYNQYVRHKVYDFSVDGASSGIGDPVVYPSGEGCPIADVVNLPDTYYDRNLKIIKIRLMAAGTRLAHLLNQIAAS